MKRSILIAFIIPVILLSSCENQLFSNTIPEDNSNGDIQLLFFSDNKDVKKEEVYYDALLQIKNEFPERYNIEYASKKSLEWKYNIDVYPSLIVINENEEVVAKIEGYVETEEEIINPIVQALSKNGS